MSANSKKFSDDIAELRKFLAERRLLGTLALRSGAKSRTVQYALSANSESDLIGKRLRVYQEALAMKKEIDELFAKYENKKT